MTSQQINFEDLTELLQTIANSGELLVIQGGQAYRAAVSRLPSSATNTFVNALAFSVNGDTLTLTLNSGATVQGSVPAALRNAGLTTAQVNQLINAAGHASQAALVALTARVTDLEARVTALEGGGPSPHTMTRYAALGADGSTPASFNEGHFLSASATTSMTQDITTPASNADMVVAVAVPSSEGPLTGVAELASDGSVNQFATMIRGNFLPAVGDPEVTLDISGESHYVYCTNSTIRALFLGMIGYRLTQTAP